MAGLAASRRSLSWAGFFLLALSLALPAAPALPAGWLVPEATLRYRLDLRGRPTHASAGYVVHLPDGGILHQTTPATVVMADDGKVLPSYLLWQNAESGFYLVFADPGSAVKAVDVYMRPDRLAQSWRPETGLTPSAILCVAPGRDSLSAAQALAKFGRVEPGVHAENKSGIPKAPLSVGGDDSGRPRPASLYLLSYVEAESNGKYWVAPFTRHGQSEVLIDGTRLVPKQGSKKWGGDGAFVELTRGLHRVEVFQTAPGTGPYPADLGEGGLMYLTWRPPKETLKDVEARVFAEREIARSGSCHLAGVESRDGAPVAVAIADPSLCYWVGEEEPLIIFGLQALAGGQPAGTTYSWSFPEGAMVDGASVQWMFPGFRESRVKLTARHGQVTSECVVPLFGFSTVKTSFDSATDRDAFRTVLANMLQSYPHSPDPVAGWSDAYWNNLFRTVEAGDDFEVLRRLFTDHFEAVRKKLAPGQLYALEDLLLDGSVRSNPRETLQWLQKFQPGGADSPRQYDLKVREGELQMYYLGDRKEAETLFTALAGMSNEYGERAKIRLGDLALLEGDLNKATSLYADVQNRARTRRNAAPALPPGGLVANELVKGGPPRATPTDWRSQPLALQKPAGGPAAPARGLGALQDVSLSENVHTLTEGGYLLEAQQALATWELEFPLSKISGDYIMRESAYYMKLGDWKRAQPLLEAYCREIDASSFLPDAATMLITCVSRAQEPPSSIREVIEKVVGRLKFHPVAAELNRFLSTAK